MKCVVFSILLVLLAVANAVKYEINSNIINSNVVRKIDLSTQLVRIQNVITVKNNGGSDVQTYLFAIQPQLSTHLSHISAHVSKSKTDQEPLKVEETKVEAHSSQKFYAVQLKEHKIASNSEITFVIETTFTHALKPFPSHIVQSEKQFVKFSGNLYLFSAYLTESQSTSVLCTSSNIDSFTKEKPLSIKDKNIQYGPYPLIQPFKQMALSVHYENNSPFLTVTSLTRVIEVSQWGNIAVEETFNLLHTGAILKGSFSRHDYQRNQDGLSSIKSFKTLLPLAARDIYYRDEIGNISTSSLKELDVGLELELRPRFPLFGGWKSQHYIGYNVPSYQYLYNRGDKYVLMMKMMDHVYDDQVVDHFTLKIILPERAKDIALETAYKVDRQKDTLHKTYLDIVGRPVVTITKNNLVQQHIQDFKLQYSFSKQLLLQEPLLVFVAFFVLFLTAIIFVRLDFSIAKDEATEAKLRLGGLLRQVVDLHERRSALYQSYDDSLNKFKSSKDLSALKLKQKTIDNDHKNLSQQLFSLQSKLKPESQDSADKIGELQRLDGLVRGQINLLSQCCEKFVQGRMVRSQFVEQESAIKNTRTDLLNNITNVISSL